MFKSIVVGTNGTETADIAVNRAVELAKLTGATLHVVSAYEPAPAHVGGSRPPAEAAEWAISPHFKVDAVLDRATDIAKGGGIEIEVHGPKGDAASAILSVAEEAKADLIVLGSKGMQGARRVLGSVPNKVSHRAPCDVMIVQTTSSLGGIQAACMSTRSPSNGTPSSSSSLRWASPLASEPSARTTRCQGTSGSWWAASTAPA